MKTTSLIIDDHEIEELKSYIREHRLKRVNPTNKYELLRVKDCAIGLVLYKSGKLVYNGNEASKRVLDDVLKKEENYDYILGSDEAGKGEWYGSLVVVTTALSPEEIIELRKLGVKDSKTIKKPQIMTLARNLIEMDFMRRSVILNPETYNKLYSQFQKEGKNLNDIMAWAHSNAIKELLEKIEFKRARVVIDKFDLKKTEYRLESLDKTNLEVIQKSGAESEIPVAAASIMAKYLFETGVDKLNEEYQVNLRTSKPENLNPEILPEVAKIHFKNVKKVLTG
jgi:ribonuclease HIII